MSNDYCLMSNGGYGFSAETNLLKPSIAIVEAFSVSLSNTL